MSKVMIVEDDDSLREIYAIRLTAEGYAVVSAHDGEEALAVAVRERPDLIISDVMMPKISGFDMLDILRSTPETANIRVIMMTALSSEDQRQRGEGLGADRYLVKSQVGIEDVVNTVHEVLGDRNAAGVINPEVGGAAPAPTIPAETAPVAPTDMAAAMAATQTTPAMPPVVPPAVAENPVMPATAEVTTATQTQMPQQAPVAAAAPAQMPASTPTPEQMQGQMTPATVQATPTMPATPEMAAPEIPMPEMPSVEATADVPPDIMPPVA